ncbi:porin family protein [Emcibacteraceae bacterium]|nr:porin family protein [Emcibacteraceae bacterium]MDA9771314.1 porin family protein [Emcibacteraceae bacterium]
MNLFTIRILGTLLFSLMTVLASANAQNSSSVYDGPYIGGNISYQAISLGDTTELGGSTKDKFNGMGFGGVFGYRMPISDEIFIGVESFLTKSLATKEFSTEGALLNVGFGSSYGLSGTIGFTLGDNLLFISTGYGWANINASVSGTLVEQHKGKGVRIGAGFELPISENLTARIQTNFQSLGQDANINEEGVRNKYSNMTASSGLIFNF